MNPNISSFVPVSHKILKYIINAGPKQYIKESIITSISPWWQFKLTEKHSKSLSAFATIRQVIAIQCISQHPYIVAVSRITVEGLDVLYCSFIFLLYSETKIKIRLNVSLWRSVLAYIFE